VIVLTNQRRFYPLLSHAIADLRLPAAPEARPVRDHRPALTAHLRDTLTAAAEKRLDPTAFTADAGQGAVDFYGDFGQAMLSAVGPIRTVEVMAERTLDSGELRRRYRVSFERRTLEFVVRTDPAGLFTEIRPLSGDDL